MAWAITGRSTGSKGMSVNEMPNAEVSCAPADSGRHLQGNLGVIGLLLTYLAGLAPLVGMGTYVPVVVGLGVGTAAPLVYVGMLFIALALASGVVGMARHMVRPGALYTYITAGLGRIAGLAGGLGALTTYILYAATSYMMVAIMGQPLITALHGPSLPWWVWSLIAWIGVSILTLLNIDVSTRVLGFLLCLEVIAVLLWEVRVMANGGPDGRGLNIATGPHGGESIGVAMIFAVSVLTGFEVLQVFRNETPNPERAIPRATYLSVSLVAAFYTVGAYVYLVAFGADAAVASVADPANNYIASVATYAGVVVGDIAKVLMVTSALAAQLTYQNVAARYAFAFANDRVLPSWFAAVHPRFRAPTRSAALVAGTVLILDTIVVVLQIDVLAAFVTLAALAGFLMMVLYLAVSIAVFFYFRRNPELERSTWKTKVAPAISTVGFLVIVVAATINRATMTGGDETVATWCLVVIAFMLAAYAAYALWLSTHRPKTWALVAEEATQT